MRLPVLMVIFCYLLLLATDYAIIIRSLGLRIKDFARACKNGLPTYFKQHKGACVYILIALLTLGALTVAVCLPKREAGIGITATMWLLFGVFTVIISQIVYCILLLPGLVPLVFKKKRWNSGLWIGLPVAVVIFLSMWYGALVGRYKIETTRTEISSVRLPESFNGFKIAQISDIHVGTWGNDTTFISELVDSVLALKPDLIVFTGDAVNRVSDEFKPFVKPLSRLRAPYGVYTILGNHDYGDYVNWKNEEEKTRNLDSLKSYQRQAGWILLDNGYADIVNPAGDTITLIGVGNWGEPPFSQYGDLRKAYAGRDLHDSRFKVLLSHNPKHWEEIVSKESNIDLTLSGHTHAMQMMFSVGKFKWSPAVFKYKSWGGLYNDAEEGNGESNLYVNIGAGEVGLPMRIGATPEITLITLRK